MWAAAAAVILATSVASCGGSAPAARTTTRDSLGVRISVTDLRDPAVVPSCSLGTSPTLRLGTVMGDTAQELYDVWDARRLGGGRVAVLNGSDEVRVFDATGRPIARLGRPGEGPGELRTPVRLGVLHGDSVAVWDLGLRRITVFPVTGGRARVVDLDVSPTYPTANFAVLDGDFLIGARRYRAPRRPVADFVPQGLSVLRYGPDGALIDTLTTLPDGTAGWITAGGRAMVGPPFFEPRAGFTSDGTLAYATGGGEPRVEVMDSARDVVASIRWLPPDRTVTDAEVRAFRRRLLAAVPAAHRKGRELWLDATPMEKSFPASAGMLAGAKGDLWVKSYPRPGSDSVPWWSFARDGHFRCRLALPVRFTPLEFGDRWMLGVRKNELDVEFVELWPLLAP